jgi:hypothetical protein
LETRKPEPHPEDVRKKIHIIVEKAEAELGLSK